MQKVRKTEQVRQIPIGDIRSTYVALTARIKAQNMHSAAFVNEYAKVMEEILNGLGQIGTLAHTE